MEDFVEEYELRLKNAESIEETVEILEEIRKKYLRRCLYYDTQGNPYIKDVYATEDNIKEFIESDLMFWWGKYGVGIYPNLNSIILAIVSYSDSPKVKENAKKIIDETRKYILDTERLTEGNDDFFARRYDWIVTEYFNIVEKLGMEVDDNIFEVLKEFYTNLPEEFNFFDTEFYKKYWLPRYKDDERINSIYLKRSKEEYLEELSKYEIGRNGRIKNFELYDNLLNEYFLFYGEELSEEDIEKYLIILDNNAPQGNMSLARSFQFFEKSEKGNEVLRNNPGLVFNDILRSFHNNLGEMKELPNSIYDEIFSHMISINPETKRTYAEDYIASLSENDQIGIKIANNLIELNKYELDIYRRNFTPFIKDMYQFVSKISLYECLLMNFDESKLYDTSVDSNGLTNFDYADIALGLIAKYDLRIGINEIRDEGTKQLYERHGRDVYDSRGIRTLVTRYIDEFRDESKDRNEELERICIDFVRNVSRKFDFNLFSDQECSDIIQLAKIGRNSFAKELENEIRQGMNENPEYNMSVDEAIVYISSFLRKVGERPIGSNLEIEFDKFLKALSVIRINNEGGLIPQNINEFLIRQAMNKMSIINSNEKKYASVFERVIENYALNDVILDGGESDKIPLYFVRDYLGKEGVEGERGEDHITSKRSSIHSILDCRMDGLDTIFHENAHFGQESRKIKFAVDSYKDYMMVKEDVIRERNSEFYKKNYFSMYMEVDAREKAAEKVIRFIDITLKPKLSDKLGSGMREDIVSGFERKYDRIREEYEKIRENERENYQYIDIKEYGLGQDTVHSIFERVLGSAVIAKAVEKYPALQCEYKPNGIKRRISGQLDFIREHREELKMPVMTELLVKTKDERENVGRDECVFSALDRWMEVAESNEEVEFVNEISSQVISAEIYRFWTSEQIQRYVNSNDGYKAYVGITNVLKKAEKDNKWDGFIKKDDDRENLMDLLNQVKNGLEEKFPEFIEKLKKESPIYTRQYKELSLVTGDVVGKREAEAVEIQKTERKEEEK